MSIDTVYPVRYYSTSKRKDIALEDMNFVHLRNAVTKLEESEDPDKPPSELLRCMREELAKRPHPDATAADAARDEERPGDPIGF